MKALAKTRFWRHGWDQLRREVSDWRGGGFGGNIVNFVSGEQATL